MNYGAFTNDSLTTMYEVVRGALDADDTQKARGEEIRFRVREPAASSHPRSAFTAVLGATEIAKRLGDGRACIGPQDIVVPEPTIRYQRIHLPWHFTRHRQCPGRQVAPA
jgi:hypothetical protein